MERESSNRRDAHLLALPRSFVPRSHAAREQSSRNEMHYSSPDMNGSADECKLSEKLSEWRAFAVRRPPSSRRPRSAALRPAAPFAASVRMQEQMVARLTGIICMLAPLRIYQSICCVKKRSDIQLGSASLGGSRPTTSADGNLVAARILG